MQRDWSSWSFLSMLSWPTFLMIMMGRTPVIDVAFFDPLYQLIKPTLNGLQHLNSCTVDSKKQRVWKVTKLETWNRSTKTHYSKRVASSKETHFLILLDIFIYPSAQGSCPHDESCPSICRRCCTKPHGKPPSKTVRNPGDPHAPNDPEI